jgi:SAM-dependent methyltransferase
MKRKHIHKTIVFIFTVILLSGTCLSENMIVPEDPGLDRAAGSQASGALQVTVEDFPAEGFILDIGGGGEGIIGQLKGSQVIAIDIRKRELEEAPPGPLKIEMDARDLKFLDGAFMTATVFFTFMYIDDSDHEKVFQEIHRVLGQGGRLLIWDVILAERTNPKTKMAFFPLAITLPQKVVKTGYGVRWPESGRPLTHYLDLAEESGFEVITNKIEGRWFFIEMIKK